MFKKIYIAASYPRKSEAIELAFWLTNDKSDKVVSSWLLSNGGQESDEAIMKMAARRDYDEVKKCDILICLIGDDQSNGGCHTELGLALAWGKEVIIIGKRVQVFHRLDGELKHFVDMEAFKRGTGGVL